jgi:outer membrane protein assembly factor BamB
MRNRHWVLSLCAGLGATVGSIAADDWPQFRGPDGNSLPAVAKLPTEWGKDKNVQWKVEVPGVAWSSPIIVGDKIIVTTAITEKQQKPKPFVFGGGPGGPPGGRPGGPPGGRPAGPPGGRRPGGPPGGFGGMGGGKPPDVNYRWEVHCLDRNTGKTLWKTTATEKKPAIATHPTNTYASETPVSDGERIYAYFGMTGVFCFDLNGKQVWNRDLGAYKMMFGWGTGSSPVLVGDRLFVQCDNEEKSFLVALDKKTGNEVWRKERPEKSSWSTPYVWKTKDRTELVCLSAKMAISYDPATGDVVWQLNGLNGGCNASPVADESMIYVGNGGPFGNSPLFAVKAGAKGDISLKEGQKTGENVAWMRNQSGPSMSSPLLYRGNLYVFDQNGGTVSCYDAKTGKEAYRKERLPKARGITASPWAYDGKIFCTDEDGQTFVLQAGKEFKLLATNKLDDMFWSSPAFANGAVIFRGRDFLYCIK